MVSRVLHGRNTWSPTISTFNFCFRISKCSFDIERFVNNITLRVANSDPYMSFFPPSQISAKCYQIQKTKRWLHLETPQINIYFLLFWRSNPMKGTDIYQTSFTTPFLLTEFHYCRSKWTQVCLTYRPGYTFMIPNSYTQFNEIEACYSNSRSK